jgi:hypothetical protein
MMAGSNHRLVARSESETAEAVVLGAGLLWEERIGKDLVSERGFEGMSAGEF